MKTLLFSITNEVVLHIRVYTTLDVICITFIKIGVQIHECKKDCSWAICLSNLFIWFSWINVCARSSNTLTSRFVNRNVNWNWKWPIAIHNKCRKQHDIKLRIDESRPLLLWANNLYWSNCINTSHGNTP